MLGPKQVTSGEMITLLATPLPPPGYAVKAYEGVEVWFHPFLTVARGGGEWPVSRTGRCAAGC
jgi:hypothetical protein